MIIPTIADTDPWLEPYRGQLERQQAYIAQAERRILGGIPIETFALGHLYFGLHKTSNGWVLREWAPNAQEIFLVCDATGWKDEASYAFTSLEHDVWELTLPLKALGRGVTYKLHVHWQGGSGYRLPSYTTYTHQDPTTHDFSAVAWQPPKVYIWHHEAPTAPTVPLIYEAHVGMSSEKGEVATYAHFTKNILPRIATLGYNTVQLMAIQEHPYYGSFGYHVSNFFAASSRFGTPSDLKKLIDTAHGLGLRVLLDIVHSHAVKNETEGLSRFDGTLYQYFHDGSRGNHTAWDSRVFDYAKPEVAHYLLSNVHFWLDEYHFDGFRFDGVTSMLYKDHGLEKTFGSYDDYVGDNIDLDALAYLRMANHLVHTVNPNATTIAEDTSGFPGLAAPIKAGGVGFDYRLSMGVPDLWIKTLKERRDDDWDLGLLFHELTTHRPEEKTISYTESHDQALVGDKTLIFRLIDKDMYDHMSASDNNLAVDRGMALHKLIRLLTATTSGGGYLTFMGNEFGHPEWIDFPREGNNWSYHYARRQWSLADNPALKYQFLQNFDTALVKIVTQIADNHGTKRRAAYGVESLTTHSAESLATLPYDYAATDQDRKLLSYRRGNYIFVINLSPTTSYINHEVPAPNGDYKIVLSSDAPEFGGQGRVNTHLTYTSTGERVRLYVPSRVALILKVQ